VKEFEVYVPLAYNDGTPIEPDKKLERIGEVLLEQFGGLNYFPQPNRGIWKLGEVAYRDEIVIFSVITDKTRTGKKFLRQLKERLKNDLKQGAILIVGRAVGRL
jgi:hypothetical protein